MTQGRKGWAVRFAKPCATIHAFLAGVFSPPTRSESGGLTQQQPVYLRRMERQDVTEVLEIEKEAFSPMWVSSPFKRDLHNKRACYLVACLEPDAAADAPPPEPEPPETAGQSWLSRLAGRLGFGGNEEATDEAADYAVAVDQYLHPVVEVTVEGSPGTASADAMLAAAMQLNDPHLLIRLAPAIMENAPAQAHVCLDTVCYPPVTDPSELAAAVKEGGPVAESPFQNVLDLLG